MTFQASPSGKLARRTLLRHALAAVFAIGLLAGIGGVARADDQSQANGLVQSATKSVRNFLVNPKWQAVRNLMGGARAIYIVPHDVQGGFLLTASGGQGSPAAPPRRSLGAIRFFFISGPWVWASKRAARMRAWSWSS